MEPTSIDAVQINWLWKLLSGAALFIAGVTSMMWQRLEGRVQALEDTSVKSAELTIIREDIRVLSEKIDRSSERAEERGNRLLESMINNLQRGQ